MNIPIDAATVNTVVKWLVNNGLAIAVLGVIVYFNRQEMAEMRTDIKELNIEIKTALKSDRDTLLSTLRETNQYLNKNVEKGR